MTPENIAQTFGVSPLPLRDVISLCIGSGLFSADGEAYFTWRGCDYCSPNVGNTVTDCDGFPSLAYARQEFVPVPY